MAGKQESKVIKSTQATKYKSYSTNQLANWRVPLFASPIKILMHCRVAFFYSQMVSFIRTTLLQILTMVVQSIPLRPNSRVSRSQVINQASHWTHVSCLCTSIAIAAFHYAWNAWQIGGTFHTTTMKNLIQRCELLHQKELGINHDMIPGQWLHSSYNTILMDVAEATYILHQSERSGCSVTDLLSFHEQ